MSVETPCSDPSNDPNDWFIEKDGKQYRDDDPLTVDEFLAAMAPLFTNHAKPDRDAIEAVINEAVAEKIRLALIRRRKARDACYECPIRAACLGQRLEARIEFGTWGGYYPEELRKIEEERDARLRRRGSVD